MPTVPTRDELETTTLDGDMQPSDIIDILQRLPFPQQGVRGGANGVTHCTVALDRHVRDYIVAAVCERRGK